MTGEIGHERCDDHASQIAPRVHDAAGGRRVGTGNIGLCRPIGSFGELGAGKAEREQYHSGVRGAGIETDIQEHAGTNEPGDRRYAASKTRPKARAEGVAEVSANRRHDCAAEPRQGGKKPCF